MEKQKLVGFGRNLFAKTFHKFDEERFFDRLEEKVQQQSYFHRYKGFKNVIVALSYLFNLVSAFTASYLVFWLIKWLTGFAIIAYGLAAVFLFFIEQLKRKSSSEFFQVWYFEKRMAAGWLLLSFSILIASTVSTYYGTEQATWDFSPTASVITQDSTLNSLYAQLERTEKQITQARETRWRGTTTSKSQATVDKLTDQKTSLLNAIEQREKNKDGDNEVITTEHEAEIKITATTLAWLTVLFELLFEACIAYIWYYLYRSYVERKTVSEDKNNIETANSHLDLQQLFKQLSALNGTPQYSDLTKTSKEQLNGHDTVAKTSDIMLPVGFFTSEQRKEQQENLFKQQKQAFKQTFIEEKTIYTDSFTVPHKDFKNGQIRHVTIRYIDNMIGIYTARTKEMSENDNTIAFKNRMDKLYYWIGKREELIAKQHLRNYVNA